MCLAGNFSIFPTLTSVVYGVKSGGQIYSIVFFANALSTMTGFFLNTYATKKMGLEAFFLIATGLTVVSLILCFFFKEERLTRDMLYKHKKSSGC
jgi:Na+/melibiose symporter-like transporter